VLLCLVQLKFITLLLEYCAGPWIVTQLRGKPIYPMAIDQDNTVASGVSVGSITNVENAISASTTDYKY
jgi:hypothetical protein